MTRVSLLMLVLLAMVGCRSVNGPTESLTTDTQSSTLADDREKLHFLERYLKLRTDVTATEFHIVYHDNSTGVPGPSDWDIQVVMQVPPDQMQRWAEGRTRVTEPVDLSWGYDLAALRPDWHPDETPEVYQGDGSTVALFPTANLVFYRSTTMP